MDCVYVCENLIIDIFKRKIYISILLANYIWQIFDKDDEKIENFFTRCLNNYFTKNNQLTEQIFANFFHDFSSFDWILLYKDEFMKYDFSDIISMYDHDSLEKLLIKEIICENKYDLVYDEYHTDIKLSIFEKIGDKCKTDKDHMNKSLNIFDIVTDEIFYEDDSSENEYESDDDENLEYEYHDKLYKEYSNINKEKYLLFSLAINNITILIYFMIKIFICFHY